MNLGVLNHGLVQVLGHAGADLANQIETKVHVVLEDLCVREEQRPKSRRRDEQGEIDQRVALTDVLLKRV